MLKDLSAEYYQKIKKGFKKGLVKSIGIFLKMVANDKKNLPEDDKERLAEYRKEYYKIWKK